VQGIIMGFMGYLKLRGSFDGFSYMHSHAERGNERDLGKKWFGFSKMDSESFKMMGRVK